MLSVFPPQQEGYALDWSSTVPGRLATGDCLHHIYIWEPQTEGVWQVSSQPLVGHTKSVEDIQWSPNETSVSACHMRTMLTCVLCYRCLPLVQSIRLYVYGTVELGMIKLVCLLHMHILLMLMLYRGTILSLC